MLVGRRWVLSACTCSARPALSTAAAAPSPGVVADPHDPLKPMASIFSMEGIKHRKDQMRLHMKSSFAAGRIRKSVPDFRPNEFGRQAEALFSRLNLAYAESDSTALRATATPQLFGRLQQQLGPGAVAGAPPKNAQLVMGYPERASVVQLRVLPGKHQHKQDLFGQVTVRLGSSRIPAPVDANGRFVRPGELSDAQLEALNGGIGAESGKRKRGGDGQVAAGAGAGAEAEASAWVEAQTDDGRVYYYHKVTRETSWTRPERKEIHEPVVEAREGPAVDMALATDDVSFAVYEIPLFDCPGRSWRIAFIQEFPRAELPS